MCCNTYFKVFFRWVHWMLSNFGAFMMAHKKLKKRVL